MEGALAFADGHVQSRAHDVQVRVVGELEVVHAGHDAGEVVVRCERWLAGLAHDCEHGSKALEACGDHVSKLVLRGV